jgi:hypothetical protein
MTSKRMTIKAGKRERIRKLLTNIRVEQNMLDDNITLAEASDASRPDIVAVPGRMSRVGANSLQVCERASPHPPVSVSFP